MFFERFLKKRRQAVVHKGDNAALAELARNHEDPAVRLDAVRNLVDLGILREVLVGDADASVREIAFGRYRHLLAGNDQTPGIPAGDRLAEIERLDDARILEHLATEGREPEIRRAAIDRISSPAVLVACALHDSLATNRGAAAERLDDRQSLEQLARGIGKKDKRVYRAAREKLRLIAEREEQPRRVRAQCAELCGKLEGLGRLENWTQDRALLEHLDRQWAEIEPQAEPEGRACYEALRGRFMERYEAYRSANAAKIAEEEARVALRAERQALLDELAGATALSSESELRALRERVADAWSSLGALPPAEQKGLESRYSKLSAAAAAAEQALAEQRKRAQRLRKCVEKTRKLADDSKPLDYEPLLTLLKQGEQLAAELPANALSAELTTLAERLRTRLQHQRKSAEQRLQSLPERIAELEAHLDAGELKKADPLYQSLQASLELVQASGLPKAASAEAAKHLHALAPKLRELQHWRRWGADQHREGLCDEMESLKTGDVPPEALVERLHALQMDWRGLDRSGSPTNQALWDRFHAASEAVYDRCRPYLESQAAEREANRAEREKLCRDLEDFLSNVDWERIDWKRVLRAERETRQAWSAIGPPDVRHRKSLERRFRRAYGELDQRLNAERERNQTLKRDLIEQVRALAQAPDLDSAIERTKSLQRRWVTTVPARKRDENRLWQDFRAACDAVFERRSAQRQAHITELNDNLAVRQSICEEALALASGEDDAGRLGAGLRDLEQRWRDAESLPIPRQGSNELARQWREAREALHRRRLQAEEGRRRASLDLLGRQAGLCERLELSLLGETDDPIGPDEARQAWQQLPEQSDPLLQEAMRGRLGAALAVEDDADGIEALRKRFLSNAERREELCLKLEILAGVESPPSHAQRRLELQVTRLAGRMGDGDPDPLSGASELLHDWYLCGPAPVSTDLGARFERISEALVSRQPDEPTASGQARAEAR